MANAPRHDDPLAGLESRRVAILDVQLEGAIEDEEQLVLVLMSVPRVLAAEETPRRKTQSFTRASV